MSDPYDQFGGSPTSPPRWAIEEDNRKWREAAERPGPGVKGDLNWRTHFALQQVTLPRRNAVFKCSPHQGVEIGYLVVKHSPGGWDYWLVDKIDEAIS